MSFAKFDNSMQPTQVPKLNPDDEAILERYVKEHKHKSNQAYQALLRQSLSSFMQKTFTTVDPGATYLHNWHIDLMAEYLEACTEREITRLIINIPPRYMKSIAVSVAWPAWVIGHEPSSKFLCASYSEKLSLKHSVDCRLVLQSPWYRHLFPRSNSRVIKTKSLSLSPPAAGIGLQPVLVDCHRGRW